MGVSTATKHLTYRAAGVDIDTGEALVEDIKTIVRSTRRPEVLAGVGGFGALVQIPKGYRNPVLVSGTDGVGTKLKLGIDTGRLTGLGQDLVAMCVNDVLVSGAEPLFFLDYYATGKLDRQAAAQVVKGVAHGCKLAGCALVGGETAEMPGLYAPGDFDLAGFCVAVVERTKIIDGRRIKPGDALIALPSSGPHSNGFSLVRRIVAESGADLNAKLGRNTLAAALMAPTEIYVKPVRALLAAGLPVHGMAHITGGGITDNLTRMFPAGCAAHIDTATWKRPEVFAWLQQHGGVEEGEMRRVFNLGVGFVLMIPKRRAAAVLEALQAQRIPAWRVGEVIEAAGGPDVVYTA
ncbi:MAG: phosphoribosylformylglycinamidine cyclo-ligase [Nevskiaceae bacterium]|nr:MAG: phosphoribosylformylglycinamidine cyclo-ligase [Nevskiaceae bacterium]TBR74165.1 MAG: phosphoribosylformylglycinamidine cyclo-ligase [Nevskiaceae bacterium]